PKMPPESLNSRRRPWHQQTEDPTACPKQSTDGDAEPLSRNIGFRPERLRTRERKPPASHEGYMASRGCLKHQACIARRRKTWRPRPPASPETGAQNERRQQPKSRRLPFQGSSNQGKT